MQSGTATDPQTEIRNAHILIRGHAFLGDALMTTPFLSALGEMKPASITCCASGIGADVYRRHPAVNEVVTDPSLLKKEYDIDFVLKDTGRAALASRKLRTPLRIGFRGEGARLLLTRSIPREPAHGALRYFPLLDLPAPDTVRYVFPATREEEREAAALTQGADRPLLLSPGTTRPEKMWPEGHFSTLIRMVKSARPDTPVFLVGSDQERDLCSRIAAESGAVSLAGRTTVGVTAALLTRARLLVSGDNGVMHLAHAADCPVVALFGHTDPARSGPPPGVRAGVVLRSPLACSPCIRRPCGEGAPCMRAINPDIVFDSLVQYL